MIGLVSSIVIDRMVGLLSWSLMEEGSKIGLVPQYVVSIETHEKLGEYRMILVDVVHKPVVPIF